MKDQLILEARKGHSLTLTLNRPAALNAFNFELAEALPRALGHAARDKKLRVVVLRGAGSAFSGGGDLKLFQRNLAASAQAFRRISRHLHQAVATIASMPQIVVAAVRGPAYAAGFGVAIACDLTVASAGSRLSPSFAKIGLAPNASTTFFLPRLIGAKRAMEACLRAKVYTAAEAQEMGIVNEVWREDLFEEELGKLVHDLAMRPTLTLARIKKLIRASLHHHLPKQLELERNEIAASSKSEDFREGVTAFVEKRKPVFRGR